MIIKENKKSYGALDKGILCLSAFLQLGGG
jgi:hypothetical protein